MFITTISTVPSDFTVNEDRGSFYIDELLAVSDDQRILVGVRVILEPFEKDGVEFHELGFGISVFDEERYQTTMIFHRGEAQRYLPDDARPYVLPVVEAAIPTLVGEVKPELIFRRTAVANPPENSLHKHQMITDTLLGIGYRLHQQDTDEDGCVIWVLERGKETENGEV